MKRNELLPECPFYDYETKRSVKCEGLVDGSCIRLSFAREKGFLKYREGYCCSMNWENCPIAKMLNGKYGC